MRLARRGECAPTFVSRSARRGLRALPAQAKAPFRLIASQSARI
jgi:hypothetical protein